MSKKRGLGKLLFGVVLGAGAGLLFAPQKGSDTRKCLKKKCDELIKGLKDVDALEVRDNIVNKINDIKEEIRELDKEKVLSIAKRQAKKLQTQAEELYKYAIEKGTPILEKAADEVRCQVLSVAKEVVERLENEEQHKPKKISKSTK